MSVKPSSARATGTLLALSIATALLAGAPAHAVDTAATPVPASATGMTGNNTAPNGPASSAPQDTTDTERPQGVPGPLKLLSKKNEFAAAPASEGAGAPISRSSVIARAKTWANAEVPYSMDAYRDGYRTDCSGLVSMAWNLGTNAWTGNLDTYANRISKGELRKGDMLLFHNSANPVKGSHVVLFESWTDSSMTSYIGIEQTPPHAVRRVIPYAYFKDSGSYIPYRYKNIVEDAVSVTPTTAGVYRPGESWFYISDRNGNLAGQTPFGAP
ncbi:hypothetical protein AB0D97_36370, partial [Streptomyces roseus]